MIAHDSVGARHYAEDLGVRVNWGRWGDDDERGTLNLLTDANVWAAKAAVRTGTVVPLGAPLDTGAPPYYPDALDAAVRHEMITAWGSNAGGEVQAASDQVHMQCHGLDATHMDALCHIGHGGIGWNGRPFTTMVDDIGARISDLEVTGGPVVTRGVLVDVPRLRGIDHLEPGESVTEEDLRAAAPDVKPGDALVVRTGRGRAVAGHTRAAEAEGRSAARKYGPIAGLHPGAMRAVGELDCGLLASDGPGDTFPAVDPQHPLPVHVLALVYLGIHLLHNLALEQLADEIALRQHADFMLVAAPLRLPGGTGSPISPVAVL